MIRLPELVGSPLSINSIREDLNVSHKTISNWLNVLERLYAIFRVPPFGSTKIRAVKKEQKHYHFDWTLIQNPDLRFENMVASHLLKYVQFKEDTQGTNIELRYFRDIDGRETDFIVCENMKPIMAIECKYSDRDISPHLKYFKNKFPECECMQISFEGQKDYISEKKIRVMPAVKFLSGLV